MANYKGRRATEDDVIDLAQWAPYPPNRRTAFIQSLLNYLRVPYARVVVVEKGNDIVAFALLWFKHSAITQTVTAEIKDLVLKGRSDKDALRVLLSTCDEIAKNMGATTMETYSEDLDLNDFGYNILTRFWRKEV
jgi:hypothetical protein